MPALKVRLQLHLGNIPQMRLLRGGKRLYITASNPFSPSMIREVAMSDLFAQVQKSTAHAIAKGALLPLQSESELVETDGLPYSINHLSSLSLKDMANALQKSAGGNPFAPYDPDLFVADLSDTHVLLLNKFPIVDHHVMAISREFVPQSRALDSADFKALAQLLNGVDGLFMYNGGALAGASQPHRHVHMMPGRTAPLAAIYPQGASEKILQVAPFRFVHAFIRMNPAHSGDATYLQEIIEMACAHCQLQPQNGEMPAYNLLGTRNWLLAVPRSAPKWEQDNVSVHVSALEFGGQIGVRGPEQIEFVKKAGILSILEAAAIRKT